MVPAMGIAGSTAAQPYIGEWSNGRGEVLVITPTTIKFGTDAPVPYRDITPITDGKSFTLKMMPKGKLNYLSPFMRLKLNGQKEMSSEGADTFDGVMMSSANWFRDK